MMMNEIESKALKQKQEQGDSFFVLDVREPHEAAICQLTNSHLIPMSHIPLYLDQLPDEQNIVVYCHHGMRSAQVIQYLIGNGFDPDRLFNLKGGIDAWALEVDSAMARY